jgi:hypothetical protein
MENFPNFRQSFDFWKSLEMTIKVKGTIVDIPLSLIGLPITTHWCFLKAQKHVSFYKLNYNLEYNVPMIGACLTKKIHPRFSKNKIKFLYLPNLFVENL